MEYSFKLALNSIGTVFTIETDGNFPINKIKEKINNKVWNEMRIHHNDYVIILAQMGELGIPIDLSSGELFKTLNSNVFYIRQISTSNVMECGICYRNFNPTRRTNRWNSCSHYNNCCESCMINWISTCNLNNTNVSCPMCRQDIIMA